MLEIGMRDPDLIVLVSDISHFILQPFANACTGRYYNVGICEPTVVSMAAGLAKMGFYPVVHTIAPFILERAFEQLKLDFCYQKLHGNIVTVGSTFDYSNLGCTHHCYDDFALMKSLPSTQIVYPASCQEFSLLFEQAYRNHYLTIFRIPEAQHEQDIEPFLIQIGKALKIREGKDLTLITTGPLLKKVAEAANELGNLGWDAEILYIHTLIPLDRAMIRESLQKTGKVLVLEEHNRFGGLGYDVLNVSYDIQGLQYHCIAIDSFIHDYGLYEEHCKNLGLTVEGIINAIREHFKK